MCSKIWNQGKDGTWQLEEMAERQLSRLAHDFFKFFSELVGDREIEDIQVTGDLSNFHKDGIPDIDVHVLIDFDSFEAEGLDKLRDKLQQHKFDWDLQNNPKLRGYDVDLYLHDTNYPHSETGLYSLKEKKWIQSPCAGCAADDRDVDKKYYSLAHGISSIASKLALENLPTQSRQKLEERAQIIKRRIQKMRPHSLKESSHKTVSGQAYQKLKKEGYIDQLVKNLSYLSAKS